jgi:predicted nucleic acid-binding protein
MDTIKKDRVRLLLSDYIFDESITAALIRVGHKIAVEVGEFILTSNIVNIVWLNEILKRRAWDYFKQHDDKNFSFTDCTSFVLMNDMNIKKYFAFDDHFKQAGFVEF